MKSETLTVEQIFQNRRQYCVPFYQRAYVWTLDDHWEHLWDDIREKADARLSNGKCTPHFLGAVVLDPQPREGLRGVEIYHIIDGQQRLTTLQYVLTAVLLALHNTGNDSLANTVIGCLKNGNPETMLDPAIEIFKVWPTFRDRINYRTAMLAPDLKELAARFPAHFTQGGGLKKIAMEHPPSLAALWYFTHQLQEWISLPEAQPASARAEALIVAICAT